MSYDAKRLQNIVEGALFAAGEPLTINRFQMLFEEHDMPEKDDLLSALEALQHRAKERGFELVEVASGWRYQVRENLATWVNRLWEEKPQKYSRALLETLALIAYRQPITRGDIEDVRGVAVSSYLIKTLLEREWIKVIGHRDVPGRPSLYATTKEFLDYFNMKSLEELPSLSELKDFENLSAPLDLDDTTADTSDLQETPSKTITDEDSHDDGVAVSGQQEASSNENSSQKSSTTHSDSLAVSGGELAKREDTKTGDSENRVAELNHSSDDNSLTTQSEELSGSDHGENAIADDASAASKSA